MTETETQAAPAAETTEDASLLDQILMETKMGPADEGYDVARKGVAAFISELMKPNRQGEKVNNSAIDQMIAEVDRKMSEQVSAIMHNEDFQKLESAWRGLKFVVDRTDFRQNVKLELLNVSNSIVNP